MLGNNILVEVTKDVFLVLNIGSELFKSAARVLQYLVIDPGDNSNISQIKKLCLVVARVRK